MLKIVFIITAIIFYMRDYIMNLLSCRSSVQRTDALLKKLETNSEKITKLTQQISKTSNTNHELKNSFGHRSIQNSEDLKKLLDNAKIKGKKIIKRLEEEEKNSKKIKSEMKGQWEELISRNKIDCNDLDRLNRLVDLHGGNAIILAKNKHERKAISYIIRYNKHQQNLDDIHKQLDTPWVTQDDIQAVRRGLKPVPSAASQHPVEKKEPPALLPRTVFGSFVPLKPAGRKLLQSVSPMLISQYPTKPTVPPKPANLELKYLKNGETYARPHPRMIQG